MTRDRIDRIINAIDTGLQQAADYSYEAPDLKGHCWRCRRTPTDAPDITCHVCLFDLRGQLGAVHGPFTDEHPQHSTPQWAENPYSDAWISYEVWLDCHGRCMT